MMTGRLSLLAAFMATTSFAYSAPVSRSQTESRAVELESVDIRPGRAMAIDSRNLNVASPEREKLPKEDFSAPYKKKTAKARKTIAGNVLQNYLINHQGLRNVGALLNDQRMVRLNPDLRNALRAEGASLSGARDGMMPDAKALDDKDAALVARAARLIRTTDELNREGADLRGQIADHNARCNPAPDEAAYQWCLRNAARLNTWRADFLKRVDAHNAEVRAHNEEAARHRTAWDTFVAKIRDWEKKVDALINRIERAFDAETETCDYVSLGTNGLCIYNCELSGIRYWPKDANDSCPAQITIPVKGPEGVKSH
ncbi:MAG: hypothetical protein HYX59_16290 [Elusimicrobia bacterium]|nr:hypothetical protein [Elusimicrobiota bacterium]